MFTKAFLSLILLTFSALIHAEPAQIHESSFNQTENQQTEENGSAVKPTGIPPIEQSAPLISAYIADYEATWDAGWFPITIDAKRELEKTDNGWQVSFEAYSRVADVSEVSNFTLEGYVVKPQNYRFKTTGFLSKTKRNMEARWNENKVFLPYRKKYAEFEMPENLQDSISYQEQIRLELMQGKTEFAYPISYKDRIKNLEFKVKKEETLKSKGGPIETILVEQSNNRHRKEFTRIWFAKDHEYLLVKLYMSDKHGDTTLIELEDATLGDKKIKGF